MRIGNRAYAVFAGQVKPRGSFKTANVVFREYRVVWLIRTYEAIIMSPFLTLTWTWSTTSATADRRDSMQLPSQEAEAEAEDAVVEDAVVERHEAAKWRRHVHDCNKLSSLARSTHKAVETPVGDEACPPLQRKETDIKSTRMFTDLGVLSTPKASSAVPGEAARPIRVGVCSSFHTYA